NRTFGQPPSEETDRAWKPLFPRQGSFFKHPSIASSRSALSVFHQQHCLDGLRISYCAVYDDAMAERKLDEGKLPMMSSTTHMRHCLDLLRQSLMCQPDMTVEVKGEIAGGVTGF
ncbi:hypothetical protein EV356DRAFT_446112, partial [Viridothelium virens]